jgi:deoxyribonuclease-4
MPRLGAHLSAAGGVSRAVSAAVAAGCEALQVFLRAPGRWAAASLAQPEVARFRLAAREAGLAGVCFAHAPYLLNLASADDGLRTRSIAVLVEELGRAGRLGLAGVVLHPGSAGEGSRTEAEARCRSAITEAVERAGARGAMLLVEGTAGAGGQLGRTPAELARLVEPSLRRSRRHASRRSKRGSTLHARIGICLDTAHLWGAGYDLLGDGWERVLVELAEHWGIVVPHLLHGNDTRVELGSHRDRHAPPGEGRLGETFFRRLLTDPRCASLPVVLEIPPGDDNVIVRETLARLRSWEPSDHLA